MSTDLQNLSINVQEHLKEKIRMKYKETSILPFADNAVVRGYFNDRGMWNPEQIKDLKVMNPNIAKMDLRLIGGVQRSDAYAPEHFTNKMMRSILRDLDIMPTKEDLEAIKARKIKMTVVGYGGAMVNLLFNLKLWQHELGVNGIFNRMVLFENDNVEFTNLMRFGKEVVFEYYPKIPGSENVTALPKLMLLREEKDLVDKVKPNMFNRWLNAEEAQLLHDAGYMFVGAPTFEARIFLEDKKFYFIGHGNTEVDVTFAPKVNTSLGNETYGTIDIPVLILNLHIATAAWIKHLASGAEGIPDTDLFRFDMAAYLEAHPEVLELATELEEVA